MSLVDALLETARLSNYVKRDRAALQVGRDAATEFAASKAAKTQYADIPPGRELPGLNRAQTADAVNEIKQYRLANNLQPTQELGIPMLHNMQAQGINDWPLSLQILQRSNKGTWWGKTTGNAEYDKLITDVNVSQEKQVAPDVIHMTPAEYISQTNYDLNKYIPTDAEVEQRARQMAANGNAGMPVIDYSNPDQVFNRDSVINAYAARELGIKEMPVVYIRKNDPVNVVVENLNKGETAKTAPNYKVAIRAQGSQTGDVGYIETRFDPETKTVKVARAYLETSYRGRGLGLDGYQQLIHETLKKGFRFTSDTAVSPDSARVYEALKAQGYRVLKNPNAKEVNLPAEGTALHTQDGEPVFKVLAEPTPQNKAVLKPKVAKKAGPDYTQYNNAAEAARQDALRRAQQMQQEAVQPQPEAAPAAPAAEPRQWKMYMAGHWEDQDKQFVIERRGQGDYALHTQEHGSFYVDSLGKAKQTAEELLSKPMKSQPQQQQQAIHLGGVELPTQEAHHGSQAEFNKFTWEKIGTGEGQQTYAYGHYVTEEPSIAKFYRRQNVRLRHFPGGVPKTEEAKKLVESYFKPGKIIRQGGENWTIVKYNGTVSTKGFADTTLVNVTAEKKASDSPNARIITKEIKTNIPNITAMEKETGIKLGAVYKLEIPHKSEMMDWNDVLANQPRIMLKLQNRWPEYMKNSTERYNELYEKWKSIEAKIGELGEKVRHGHATEKEQNALYNAEMASTIIRKRLKLMRDLGADHQGTGEYSKHPVLEDMTGEELYRDISWKAEIAGLLDPRNQHVSFLMSENAKDLQKQSASVVSQVMFDYGIPGITYIGRQSDKRNFVLFDDSMVNIKEKGMAKLSHLLVGAAAGAAGVAAQHDSKTK